MRIVQINGGAKGSTGKIMMGIAEVARAQGHEVMCASPITTTNRDAGEDCGYYRIGTFNSRRVNVALARITGFNGCFAWIETYKLLKKIDEFKPEVIQLHSLHNSYINLPMLFSYIKRCNIPVVWTLHDCWAFTGQCPHFTIAKCDKWKTGCSNCPQYKEYPEALYDNTKTMWKLKKKWFTGIKGVTIVTPSEWLAGLVKKSYLKDYPVKVINNGIDLKVFKPTKSNYREKWGITGEQKVVLGVSFGWGIKKGLDCFIRLASELDERKFKIVLVGTNEKVDKELPTNIISIHRTQNQKELACIYTAADVFVNPTREEVLGLVNVEAQACGTPVVTFRTGGSPECIEKNSGLVVDSFNEMREVIRKNYYAIADQAVYIKSASRFDEKRKYGDYIYLYNEITGGYRATNA